MEVINTKVVNNSLRHTLGNKIFALETNLYSLELRIKNAATIEQVLEPLDEAKKILEIIKGQLHEGYFHE